MSQALSSIQSGDNRKFATNKVIDCNDHINVTKLTAQQNYYLNRILRWTDANNSANDTLKIPINNATIDCISIWEQQLIQKGYKVTRKNNALIIGLPQIKDALERKMLKKMKPRYRKIYQRQKKTGMHIIKLFDKSILNEKIQKRIQKRK